MDTQVRSVLLVPDPISHNLLIISVISQLQEGQSLASSDCWKTRAILPSALIDALLLMTRKESLVRPSYYLQRVPASERELDTVMEAVVELVRHNVGEDVAIWRGDIGAAGPTGLTYDVATRIVTTVSA
jgi:hypothetical protein